ncbi:MAG: hypothetical protein ACXW1D_09545 [Halobacteriota archaeon]
MAPEKLRKTCLVTAGIASSAMAAFHFMLPHVFGWARFVNDIPSPIRWGLFAINVFFSTLLLWGGVTTIITALNDRGSTLVSSCIFFGLAGFWIINASYQTIYPFPDVIMRWVLLGFSISVALLYIFGIFLSFDKRVAKRRV